MLNPTQTSTSMDSRICENILGCNLNNPMLKDITRTFGRATTAACEGSTTSATWLDEFRYLMRKAANAAGSSSEEDMHEPQGLSRCNRYPADLLQSVAKNILEIRNKGRTGGRTDGWAHQGTAVQALPPPNAPMNSINGQARP